MQRKPLRIPLDSVNTVPPLPSPVGAVKDGEIAIQPALALGSGVRHMPTPYTRRQVELMTACTLKKAEVAYIIGVSEPTLDQYYSKELKHGQARILAQAGIRLLDIALHGTGKESVTALIFYLKTQGGYREAAQRHIIAGDPDNPIRHEHGIELSTLTNEERAARILQLLNERAVTGAGLPFAERLDAVEAATRPADAGVLQLRG